MDDDRQNLERAFYGLADHVRSLAARTGRTPEDVLDQLQTMFLRQKTGNAQRIQHATVKPERAELRGEGRG